MKGQWMMQTETILKLSLRPREAAKAIGISARTLWTLTQKGEIPHTRLGRSVLYPIESLRHWLQERSERKACRLDAHEGYCQASPQTAEHDGQET